MILEPEKINCEPSTEVPFLRANRKDWASLGWITRHLLKLRAEQVDLIIGGHFVAGNLWLFSGHTGNERDILLSKGQGVEMHPISYSQGSYGGPAHSHCLSYLKD